MACRHTYVIIKVFYSQVKMYLTMTVFKANIQKPPKLEIIIIIIIIIIKEKSQGGIQYGAAFFCGGRGGEGKRGRWR